MHVYYDDMEIKIDNVHSYVPGTVYHLKNLIKIFLLGWIPPSLSPFPTLKTHQIAFDASRIDCESSENLTISAAVLGPIVGKPKGMSSALEEYLENKM